MCTFTEAFRHLVQAPATTPVIPSSTASNVGSTQLYGITPLPSSAATYTGPYQSSGSSIGPSGAIQKEHPFPERPDQPECHYYMKTGECKFGPSCRYHHPPDKGAPKANVILSPVGLPLRPVISTSLVLYTGLSLKKDYSRNHFCFYFMLAIF